jgi:RNA polymerase sigma-70 factor (ECF subfamily)
MNMKSKQEFEQLAESHRRELQVHCYRMLGSFQDAEDLVQETLLRAWQKLDTFEGRASFRAWLYKIATNVCLDALDRRPRRSLPPETHRASDPTAPIKPPITEPIWLEPFPDDLLADESSGPEARYGARESITLAFLTALQILPARQRAVLILRDVLDWHAEEVATHLELSVPAVNSVLHRARATMAKHYRARGSDALRADGGDPATRALLDQYVRAWENADIDALIALLKKDAAFPMPPSPSWYRGREAIRKFIAEKILAGDARGRFRLLPTRANGQPAFGWYQRDETGVYRAFAIHVLRFDGKLIAAATTFPNPTLFPKFGLPLELKA